MNIEVSTKALSKFDWGRQWIRPDGELSVVVVVHEPFDEPVHLHQAFPNMILASSSVTSYESERTLKDSLKSNLDDLMQLNPDGRFIITTHHAFIFNLVQSLDFRPDMFYFYDETKGYRRLTDCTPIVLRHTQNYAKMYIAGAFDVE